MGHAQYHNSSALKEGGIHSIYPYTPHIAPY